MTDVRRLDRRQFLKTGAAGAALTLGVTQAVSAAADEAGWIDAHSHIWSRDLTLAPLANGQTLDDLKPPSFTTEELFRTCEPEGVRQVVLIQHYPYHGWNNDYLIHEAARFPDRLRVVGMLDDTQPGAGQKMRELLQRRVTGFRITPRGRGNENWLTGDGMQEMWSTGAQTGQAMCCLIGAEELPRVDAMCAKNPGTPVVIDHFARIGVDGEIRKSDVDQLCRLSRHPKTFVKVSAFYALGRKKPPYDDLLPMIRRLLDAYGPERLMWASDSPYQLTEPNSYAASIRLIRDDADFLSTGDRECLLRKTAAAVYFFQ